MPGDRAAQRVRVGRGHEMRPPLHGDEVGAGNAAADQRVGALHGGRTPSPATTRVGTAAADGAAGSANWSRWRRLFAFAVVETMKMEHALTAPFAGVVRDLVTMIGEQVEMGEPIMRVEGEEGEIR